MIQNDVRLTLGVIRSRIEAEKVKKSGEKVCFRIKGKTICAPIDRANEKTVTILHGMYKYRIPYGRITKESEWVPYEDYKKNKSDTFTKRPSVTQSDYEKSNAVEIKPIPKTKLNSMHENVVKFARCLDDMRAVRNKCTLDEAKCEVEFKIGKECARENALEITNKLNAHYKLPKNTLVFEGKRPSTWRGGEELGHYVHPSMKIRLYPYTGKLEKISGNKTALETLVHEWNHHYDHRGIGLSKSPHTSGFYKRVGTVYNQLKEPLDKGI